MQAFGKMTRMMVTGDGGIPKDVKEHIPTQVPTWGAGEGNEGKAKATWLG